MGFDGPRKCFLCGSGSDPNCHLVACRWVCAECVKKSGDFASGAYASYNETKKLVSVRERELGTGYL